MVKLLSILSLILALVLFPPAVLAVISNNAIPGDSTYPIKRSLEDIIFTMASINPTTKALFSAARSDRRFKELNVLITQGKQAGDTLNELVEQTEVAASQIAQVSNQTQKQQLVEQLTQSIEKYDQGLQRFTSFSEESITSASTPPTSIVDNTSVEPSSVAQATALPQASVLPSPGLTVQPTGRTTPQPVVTSKPSLTPSSPPTPTPIVQPAPIPSRDEQGRERQREIEEARRKLEEIRKRLQQQSREEKRENSNSENKEDKEDKKNKEDREKDRDSDLTPKNDDD